MTNELTPQENKLPKAIKLLLWLSFGLWIYSLFALGIDDGSNEPYYGILILLVGTFFGWLGCLPFPTGCAVYANYFYLFALYRLAFGTKIPTTSTTFMLILASLTFFVQKIAVGESGHWTDIDAWGWGAIWWGLSLITLTIATYSKSGKIPLKKSLPITAIIYAVVVFPLIALFLYQYHTANEQEKAQYFIPGIYGLYPGYDRENDEKNNHFYSVAHIFFSGGTAFVVDKNAFSHIKYSTPPALPKNSVLQINGKIDFSENWSLIADDLAIGLPSSFVYQGKLYQRQNSRHTYYFIDNYYDASLIKVTPFTNQIDYTMDLSQTNKKGVYHFTIYDENKKNIFYQTDMVKKWRAYPFDSYRDYRYSLNNRTEPLPNQIEVSDKCTNQASLSIKDEHIALSVNNADYIIIPEKDLDRLKNKFRQYRVDDLYCSEDIVIMPVKIMEDDKINNIIFLVFDKYNMELIDEFNLYKKIYNKHKDKDKEYILNAIQPIVEYSNDRINSDYTFIYTKEKDTPRREESRLAINRLGYILEL
ncbi:MAG: hypothetical protein IKI11_09895 [Neisseriaceae bacterium]|nr:hypothetical protein [Neisseriaceae bacterium]